MLFLYIFIILLAFYTNNIFTFCLVILTNVLQKVYLCKIFKIINFTVTSAEVVKMTGRET